MQSTASAGLPPTRLYSEWTEWARLNSAGSAETDTPSLWEAASYTTSPCAPLVSGSGGKKPSSSLRGVGAHTAIHTAKLTQTLTHRHTQRHTYTHSHTDTDTGPQVLLRAYIFGSDRHTLTTCRYTASPRSSLHSGGGNSLSWLRALKWKPHNTGLT